MAERALALPLLNIEEPTVKMTFSVNNSPFAGREGTYVTSRQVCDRLYKELELTLPSGWRMTLVLTGLFLAAVSYTWLF